MPDAHGPAHGSVHGSVHGSQPDGGVRVSVGTAAPHPAVWGALTRPEEIACWLGNLDLPMRPGAAVRLDFGDGDFFDIEVDEVRDGELLDFRWRFLGLGPEADVRWSVTGGGAGGTVVVTVEDRCPGRPPSEQAQLTAGWTDFLGRLSGYLATGRPTRYEWRSVIDGSTRLPGGGWHPLRAETVGEWMPVVCNGAVPQWFFVVDDDGPRRFPVTGWRLVRDRHASFSVVMPAAGGDTRCEVTLDPGDGGAWLSVRHDGWTGLVLTDFQSRTLRHRFAAAWVAALGVARERAGRRPTWDARSCTN